MEKISVDPSCPWGSWPTSVLPTPPLRPLSSSGAGLSELCQGAVLLSLVTKDFQPRLCLHVLWFREHTCLWILPETKAIFCMLFCSEDFFFFLRDGQRKPSMFSPAPWGGYIIIWPLKWILLGGVFATDLQPHLTFTKMRLLCALQMSCVTWLPWENCISSQLICCHSRKNKLHHANGVFQTRLSLKESNLLFSTFNGRLSKMSQVFPNFFIFRVFFP